MAAGGRRGSTSAVETVEEIGSNETDVNVRTTYRRRALSAKDVVEGPSWSTPATSRAPERNK
jgi:hypothetical protein